MNKVIKQKWTDKDKFYREDLFTRAFDKLADRYAKARKQKAQYIYYKSSFIR